jgi:hypothetical protein
VNILESNAAKFYRERFDSFQHSIQGIAETEVRGRIDSF